MEAFVRYDEQQRNGINELSRMIENNPTTGDALYADIAKNIQRASKVLQELAAALFDCLHSKPESLPDVSSKPPPVSEHFSTSN